jgi:uncharacterized protein YndB with AHSA1/START domain
MRFSHQLRYDAPPDTVHAMLADPEFREKVCAAQHATTSTVEIRPDGDGMSVQVDQRRPSDGLPGFARKIVGDDIQILQKEDWSGSTHAVLAVTIPGKPGELEGTIRLAGDGIASTQTIEGDLKVGVPLIGAKLEALIADLLTQALRAEERVGRAWLGGER